MRDGTRNGRRVARRDGLRTTRSVIGLIALVSMLASLLPGPSSVVASHDPALDAERGVIDPLAPAGAAAGSSVSAHSTHLVLGAPEENEARGAVYVFQRVAGAYEFHQRIDAGATAEPGARFGADVDVFQRFNRVELLIGAPGETVGGLTEAGAFYGYRFEGASFVFRARGDAGPDAQQGAAFGSAVGLAARNAPVVGAPGQDVDGVVDAGIVFQVGINTGEIGIALDAGADRGAVTRFGAAIDTNGSYLVIGAPGGEGAVYRYGAAGDEWRRQQRYPGPLGVEFGASVSIWGGVTSIGSPADLGGAGSVRLYDWPSGGPVEIAQLDGGSVVDGIGTTVAVMDGIVASGNSGGRAVAWSRIDGVWGLDRELTTDLAASDRFGADVAIEGTTIFVGHPGADTGGVDTGVVEFLAGTYDEQPGRVTAADGDPNDRYGTSVATDGATTLVGAPEQEEPGGNLTGKVYVYDTTGAEPIPVSELVASDASNRDEFGTSVAIDGALAIVGAPNDDPAVSNAGSVYVFFDDGAGLAEIDRFQASQPAQGGGFGSAVHLERLDDGRWFAVVGAPGAGAGVAEAFFIDPGAAPVVTHAATLTGTTPGDQFGASVASAGTGAVAVGAPVTDVGAVTDAGAVRVYRTDDLFAPLGYTLVDEVVSSQPGDDARYGSAVDIEGRYLAVGAASEDVVGSNAAGRGYGYELVGGTYEEQVQVATTSGTLGGNRWGSDVALEGDLLVVAVDGQDDRRLIGRALQRDGDTWVPSEEIRYAGPTVLGRIGRRIALAPDGRIYAGGPTTETRSGLRGGAVYYTDVAIPEPPPEVVIGRPVGGAVYEVGDAADALFVCRDGAGVTIACDTADVDGTAIASGDPLPTGVEGTFTLTVTAGETTVTTTYDVVAPLDATVDLDYRLSASTVPVGATSVPLAAAPAAEIGGEDADVSGVSAAPLDTVDFDQPPTGTDATSNPLGDVTLGQLGLDTLGPAADLLSDISLIEFPVDGGWEQYLVGTAYEGVPLQTVTIGDIYGTESVQSIPIRFSDVAASPIRFSDIAVVAFAGLPVLDIDLDGDPTTDPLTEWCGAAEAQGLSCDEVGLAAGDTDATLGALAVAGFDIEASPIRFSPIRFSYIEASPIRFSPIRFSDIEASPIRFSPIRFSDVQASPIRFSPIRFSPIRFSPIRFSPIRFSELREVPIRFSPIRFSLIADIPSDTRDRIVDCGLVDCTDPSLTIDDAIALGAYIGAGATYDDLGDAILGDLRVEDVLVYLDADVLAGMEQNWETSDLTLGDLDLAGGVGDLTLGDLEDGVWEAIEQTIGDGYVLTVEELFRWFDFEHPDFPDITIGDFLLLFLPRESYAWGEVDVASLGLQTAGDGEAITATIDITVDDVLDASVASVSIVLPESAVIDPGSIQVTAGSALIIDVDLTSDRFVTFDLLDVEPSTLQQVSFALYPGLDLGTSETTVEVDVAGVTEFATTSLSVTEAFEPRNDTPDGAVGIVDDTLYLSHISTATDLDYYRMTVPDPDTQVSVKLSNLPADYDLVVFGPEAAPIVPITGGDVETVPDPDFDVNPSNDATAPAPLDDLVTELPGLDTYGVSYNRDTRDDQVDFLAALPGDYIVQISKGSTLGAEADQTAPYALRVAAAGGESLPCPARTFPDVGVVGSSTPIDATTNTLIVVNQQRLGALFGASAAADVVAKLDQLIAATAADADDVVDAAVLAVDSIDAVAAAYQAWDENPCDPGAVNDVVGEIADQIASIRATNDIDHVLIVGGDDVIPFGRVDDATRIANEQGYTSSLGTTNNALRAAMAGSLLLTDEPYGDREPVRADNREVYVTEVSLGRLVEGPAEIIANIDLYLASGGRLDPQTGFVAGYDFLDDGSAAVADVLDGDLDGTVERLIDDGWSAQDLDAGLTPPADVNSIAAHFDHYRALPADESFAGTQTDLFEFDALSGSDYSEAIVFSMGCHAGLSVSDDLLAGSGVEANDWAQTFLARQAAVYVGATGYAYGDDVTVALTEKLMVLFAEGLGRYGTVGEAMLYAKQEYSADLTAYGVYDEKALMESTMYGIPFFRLGNPALEVEINEPTLSSSPFGPFANLAVSPDLRVAGAGTEDTYWYGVDADGDEQVQVTSGYPILPTVEVEVTQQVDGDPGTLELDARGVMLESLTTTDEAGVDAATARAVFDSAEQEPNSDPAEVTFALAPTVNTFLSPGGVEQQVTMTAAAFESTSPGGVGTMRLYDDVGFSVYYAEPGDADVTDPVFRDVESTLSGGVLSITAQVDDASGVDRVTALVTATPSPGTPTTWSLVELSPVDGAWTGSTSVDGQEAEFLLQALDGVGNVGTSFNKQLSFGTDRPAPETLTVELVGSGSDGVYRGPVTVTATSSTGADLAFAVDSGAPTTYTGPFVVFTPGLHLVTVISETGLIRQIQFRIVGPACTIIGTEGPDDIVGTDGRDVICALGGKDTIDGLGGDDVVYAGRGPDTIVGGAGNDTIVGGDGPDVLVGGAGDDLLDGESGPDELDGGDGFDRCAGFGDARRGNGGDRYRACESSP